MPLVGQPLKFIETAKQLAQPCNKINRPRTRSTTNAPPTQPDTTKKQSFQFNRVLRFYRSCSLSLDIDYYLITVFR
jgi:hypothetical protein